MRFVLGLFLLMLWHSAAHPQTLTLLEVEDASLTSFLANMEIIAERRDPVDRTFPYFLRVIRVSSGGECDGSPQSCPTEVVYISISSRDESPDQKLYRLPDAYGWEMSGWQYLPKQERPDDFIVFEMSRKVIAKDTTRSWWSQETYEVKVNLFSGTIRKL